MGLEKLLYLQGVGAEFIDCFGNNIQISSDDRNGILKSMCLGYSSTSDTADDFLLSDSFIGQRIYDLDAKPWLNPLHQFQWSYVDAPIIEVYLPEYFLGNLCFEIISEQNETYRFQVHSSQLKIVGDYGVDSVTYLKYQYSLSNESNIPLGLGYHQISLKLGLGNVDSNGFEADSADSTFNGSLMISPRSAYCGNFHGASHNTSHGISAESSHGSSNISPMFTDNHVEHSDEDKSVKPWGISTQLYSIKSKSQWGIGDFNDLKHLIDYAAEQGADFILLNPLHVLDLPANVSPYSPDDRRLLNPLYIHIESVEEFNMIQQQIESDEFQNKKHQLAQDELLNYQQVFEVKYAIYRLLFDAFVSQNKSTCTKRYKQFSQFKQQQGEALSQYVKHQTSLQAEENHSDNATAFNFENFLCYLQFIAFEQLALCQLKAKSVGMLIGLVRDMAVGASPTGSEVQQNTHYFCQQANIGAPPDPFAPQGQNWGLTPLDPINLQQNNYQHFINLIRSNMQSCGGLRIDHVMGLLRLWWWPSDPANGKGAYVYYPLDTLLAILCLESQRAQCLLIGEDLGIVPPEIVQNLSKARIFSNELFYFTKHYHGFTSPEYYKSHSLMMLANHDVPTLTAWWNSDDINLRHQLELIDDEQLNRSLNDRHNEKQQLVQLLEDQQLLMPQTPIEKISTQQLFTAWLSLTASGQSTLYSVQIDDLIHEKTPINIPGTWKEYPNWRRRLSLTLEQIVDSNDVKQKLQTVNKVRHNEKTELSEPIHKVAESSK
ncbi:4-alpha-glucanotransferase [Shewanella olleyana]|uniref:4-alpha-glucanotransferase n=1 Tax=Shewanella olleyana TaxID=135626 RepID=UPI00200DC27D|nr:4-alpha-glucanotransferase [Shewanella olleyana]MCL1068546.1 4-alpha-glucanotransferase [Shewanella olleyana]